MNDLKLKFKNHKQKMFLESTEFMKKQKGRSVGNSKYRFTTYGHMSNPGVVSKLDKHYAQLGQDLFFNTTDIN